MIQFPFLRTTIDLLEHRMLGGLCSCSALGWTPGSPVHCSGLWELRCQFLPPSLEEQCRALSLPSLHVCHSKLLLVQKVRQVLPELIAGRVRGQERLSDNRIDNTRLILVAFQTVGILLTKLPRA